MADHQLIHAYLCELRASLVKFEDAAIVLEEAEDHLIEAVSHLEATGLDHQDAQVQALARYGSAAFVSRSCIIESRKGAAVSTTFTRRAGLAAAITPFLLVLGIIGNTVYWGEDHGPGGTLHGASSGLLLPLGLIGFLLGLLGLRARHRGLGRLGTVALGLVVAAPFLSVPAGWGAGFVAVIILSVAVAVMGVAMLRAGVLPVAPLVMFVAGPLVFLAVCSAIAVSDVAGSISSWALFGPLSLTVIALSWLGWYQWNEPALDRPGNSPLATV